jgi:hypothetical protein
MRNKLALAALVLLPASVALADDDVALQPGDSLTVDGTRYHCAPDGERDGVTLAVGDSITKGDRRVTCGAAAPKEVDEIEVASFVVGDCLHSLYMKVSGGLPQRNAAAWASACRNMEIGKKCTVTSADEDSDCLHSLNMKISGSFDDDIIGDVVTACRRIVATCPLRSTTRAATSEVSEDCMHTLYMETSGTPSVDTVLGWLDKCRTRKVGRCMVVGGGPDLDCIHNVNMKISGTMDADQAADVALRCRKIEMRCR